MKAIGISICLVLCAGCMNMKSTYTINVAPPKDVAAVPATNTDGKTLNQTGGQIVNISINTSQDKPVDITTKAAVGDKATDAIAGAVGGGAGAAVGGIPGAVVGAAAAPILVEGVKSVAK